ncbi:hypothetical protein PENTCL1PPCAC_21779, partial [Pristionchus entomophagus]
QIDKSIAPILFKRIDSITRLANELTEENEALKLKISQLTNEVEERKCEFDAVKEEFDQYKKSESELNEMKNEVTAKSEEIENLKKNEAESKNRIS